MSIRLFIWGGHDRVDLIREAVEAADATITGVGASSPRESADLAEEFGVDRIDDLRAMIQGDGFELLWLAGDEPLAPDIRQALWTAGCPVVSTEPRPASLGEVVESRSACPVETVPLFRAAPGMVAAGGAIETFGEIRTMQVAMRCPGQQGTLFSRLFDAVDTARLLLGECQSATATLSGASRDAPESPRGLRGWLSALLQFEGGRSASLLIGDLAPQWFRGLTLVGDGGVVRVTDTRCEMIPDAGPASFDDDASVPTSPAKLFAAELVRAAEGRCLPGPHLDHRQLLATCETVRLSCLTGHVESTHTMREMLTGS